MGRDVTRRRDDQSSSYPIHVDVVGSWWDYCSGWLVEGVEEGQEVWATDPPIQGFGCELNLGPLRLQALSCQ